MTEFKHRFGSESYKAAENALVKYFDMHIDDVRNLALDEPAKLISRILANHNITTNFASERKVVIRSDYMHKHELMDRVSDDIKEVCHNLCKANPEVTYWIDCERTPYVISFEFKRKLTR